MGLYSAGPTIHADLYRIAVVCQMRGMPLPPIKRLAWVLGLHPSTLRKHLSAMHDGGVIVLTSKKLELWAKVNRMNCPRYPSYPQEDGKRRTRYIASSKYADIVRRAA